MEIVDRIEREMKRQKISKAELAAAAGVGLPYLYRVFKGQQTPTIAWAEKVCDVLGLEIKLHRPKSC